ncbi:ribosomal RNA processing protein 1 homolog B-like isoform X2 [Dendrobates tinctorius]
MSQLVHALQSRPSQNLFIRSFWQTLNREWNGIDRLRLDKFYTLSRFVLRQSVELLKKGDWEESLVENFLTVLVDEVLKPEAPQGVQHHLIDIYLDELAKVGSAELSADLNLKLIEPFCRIAAKSKDFLLRQSVVTGIFQAILEQSPFAIEDLMKEVGHTDSCNGDNGSESKDHHSEDYDDIGPVLQFDYQALADRLFNLASRKNVPARNRRSLYRLVKRFKDLADGIFPQDGAPEDFSTDEDDDDLSSSKLRKRQKQAQEKMALSSQTVHNELKKGKRVAETSKNPPEMPAAKKKRKKKKGDAEEPEINGETLQHPNTKETEALVPLSSPEPSKNSGTITRLRRRRRRGCLLRLGLRILPLRGAIIMKRRRLIRERRKMTSSKVTNLVTSSECLVPAQPSPAQSTSQDFITFHKTKAPNALYVKGSKSKGRPISKVNCKSKKVTFSLNRNMTAEFKRTDRSLLVSPAGSSRVPFNPNQRPQHSVLKTPTPTRSPAPRAKAADFF